MTPLQNFHKPFSSAEEYLALAAEMAGEDPVTPPPETPDQNFDLDWEPALNPVQAEIYYDQTATAILAHGELASGKTICAIHKLVDHCFENWNALAIVVVLIRKMAEEGGTWHKLMNDVLPQWREGRKIQFTQPGTTFSKDSYVWVSNRFGGWSRILLVSMPVESVVAKRIKGQEPSFILVDEAQTLVSKTYFTSIGQRLNRRSGIRTKQQIIYCANPEGPSHWLYKLFFVQPVDPVTGAWNPFYAHYHVPIAENKHNLPADYYDTVMEAVKGDPIEEARMLRGEWIDRPSGEALFAGFFIDARHVRPAPPRSPHSVMGLMPVPGFRITLGYDLGAAHTAIFFLQLLATLKKNLWLVFDELDFVGRYMPYIDLVPIILRRMAYWNQRCGSTFTFEHISDNSAFNQYRAVDGSYDVWDVERISNHKIRLIACPKPRNSVSARVQMFRSKLTKDEVLISARCTHAISMCNYLESEKLDPSKLYNPSAGLNPKRSPYIHRFDAITYPMFYYELGGNPSPPANTPQVYAIGA